MESRNVDQDHECIEEETKRETTEELYNYAFVVKYQQIKNELMEKQRTKDKDKQQEQQEGEQQQDNDDCYSEEDIVDICQKLYVDEILSVFGAESMFDDKIDVGLAAITRELIKHPDYKRMMEQELRLLATDDKMKTDYAYDFDGETESNQLHLLSCMLFSEGVFHVTHRVLQHLKQIQDTPTDRRKKEKSPLFAEMQQALHKIILEVIYGVHSK